MTQTEANRVERVELILQQLQGLPTLSSVATRLLQYTSDDRSDLRDIVKMIESDPALTAKVLSLCRRAHLGLSDSVRTVDRAVVMLGFEAIRSAVLSIEIYSLFPPADGEAPRKAGNVSAGGETGAGALPMRFDREGFWKHSLAVAVGCELIAAAHGQRQRLSPDEAFVCGLLHDLGKIALDRLLPKSYERVVELAEMHLADVAEMERKVIGLDHHTAGKRLAEQWRLPHILQDVMWLHGQPFESLPDLPHRLMIGLVTVADALARSQHIGDSANRATPENPATLMKAMGLDPGRLDEIIPMLHEQVRDRAAILGLGHIPPQEMFLESIARANAALGRINETLERRSAAAAKNERVLRGVSDFHQQAVPAQSVAAVCGNVAASAARELGPGFYLVLRPAWNSDQWHVMQFGEEGRLLRSHLADPPPGGFDLRSLADDMQMSVGVIGFLPWLSEFLGDSADVRRVQMLPLRCGWGLSALLLHDRPIAPTGLTRTQLQALCETWAAAIAAAAQHEGAKRLGEQLAESSRVLTETQAKLARSRVMASLGEMAAGAAHEMNNPLCVISGRSQVLAIEVEDEKHRAMAQQIVQQANRLSDLITSLHLFAEPPRPRPRETKVEEMIGRIVKTARERRETKVPICVTVPRDLPAAYLDDEQIGGALLELMVNAIEAGPHSVVEVSVQIDPGDDRLVIMVRDDGHGMTPHTLTHAFDPFFSDKPAGRQPGLGLARAQRLAAINGGAVTLDSAPGRGTSARLVIGPWRMPTTVSGGCKTAGNESAKTDANRSEKQTADPATTTAEATERDAA